MRRSRDLNRVVKIIVAELDQRLFPLFFDALMVRKGKVEKIGAAAQCSGSWR